MDLYLILFHCLCGRVFYVAVKRGRRSCTYFVKSCCSFGRLNEEMELLKSFDLWVITKHIPQIRDCRTHITPADV